MKNKILFLLIGMFILISIGNVSAEIINTQLIYDEINDSSINASLWGVGGTGSSSENTLVLSFASSTSVDGTYTVSSNALRDITVLQNLTFHVVVSASDGNGGGSGAAGYGRLYIFGNNTMSAVTYDNAGTGGASDDSVWTVARNLSAGINKFDIYDDGVYMFQITASTNVIYMTAERGGAGASGVGASGSIAYLYYSLLDSNINVSLNYPTNDLKVSLNSLFNVSLSITGTNQSYNWINNTYHIWYSNGTLRNTTIVTGLSTNSTNISRTIGTFNLGNYLWNSYACYGNATFNNCSWGSSGNYSFSIGSLINSNTANALGYETGSETYTLNITTPTGYTPTNAYLVYNGTSYLATVTSSGGNYLLSKTLQIPSSQIGANTFYYKWNLSSTFAENSSIYNQTINPIQFGLCNATLTVPYLNITFKDEGSLSYIKASIPSSAFVYYLGDGSINKTLTFVNTTANSNYAFCSLPSNKTYYIDSYVQYKNDTSYPQRIWDELVKTYTNVTTNKTLYLLDSADGIYVTYQVLDGIGNQLSGVEVMVNRTIEGSDYVIGTGITDLAGSVTLWLNPDFAHSLSFSKTGYETFYLAQFPTQESYTVTLGQTSSSGVNDYIRGVVYTIKPNYGITLNVSQLYNFNMTMNSSYWTLDSFGFILYGDDLVIGGNSSSTSSGFIYNILNVSSYDHIRIRVYWVVNGTTVYGENNGWFTFDYEEGTGWSIKNFFSDLSKYSGEGMFGLTTNALNFIIFVIIFVLTGIVSYKFSFTSPAVVSGVIFGLVFLFDVALGLISMPFLTVLHFPTIFMLLITVALAIWESRR